MRFGARKSRKIAESANCIERNFDSARGAVGTVTKISSQKQAIVHECRNHMDLPQLYNRGGKCRHARRRKINAGILFSPADPELKTIKLKTHNLNVDYNNTYEDEEEKRAEILSQIIGELGEGGRIQGPIAFHYGKHTKIGRNFFGNFNLTIQDDAEVTIGDNCNFGPNVTIVTPVHPMLPNERRAMLTANGEKKSLCYARPVHIGNDCWFGASVTVCPGVTIGDNCVIGAGSVVTRDIPAGSFAAGVPCRVIRKLTEADSLRHLPDILADNSIIE